MLFIVPSAFFVPAPAGAEGGGCLDKIGPNCKLYRVGCFMADLARIDKIISEINELGKNEKIIFFQRIGEEFEKLGDQKNGEISIESVFGLWKNRNITKEALRKKAWMKN